MKPTISIFEDEIVITTDSFDLILKTGVSREGLGVRQYPPAPLEEGNEDQGPYENMGNIDWDNDPFAPSMDSLEKSIAEYKEQHPEQFGIPKIKYTDQRIVNVPVEKAVVYTSAEIADRPPLTSRKIGINSPKEGKRTREHPAKPCIVCGNDFKPTWNTQRYCPACKPKYYGQKRKPLAEQTTEELEKTLQEIENRRKKPYEFK